MREVYPSEKALLAQRKKRRAVLLLFPLLFVACSSVMPQTRTTLTVTLSVENDILTINSDSNCLEVRPKGEICVANGVGAEIVFSLDNNSVDWEFSEMLIRDPAENWGDRLPVNAESDFSQFDGTGRYEVPSDGSGITIIDANQFGLAVQYKITVRNKQSGKVLPPAHGVIDNDGGSPGPDN
jgi:hypothetical protein